MCLGCMTFEDEDGNEMSTMDVLRELNELPRWQLAYAIVVGIPAVTLYTSLLIVANTLNTATELKEQLFGKENRD